MRAKEDIINILGEIEKDKNGVVIGCIYGTPKSCIYCKQYNEINKQQNKAK